MYGSCNVIRPISPAYKELPITFTLLILGHYGLRCVAGNQLEVRGMVTLAQSRNIVLVRTTVNILLLPKQKQEK